MVPCLTLLSSILFSSIFSISTATESCTFSLSSQDSLVNFKDTILRPYLRQTRNEATDKDIVICLGPGTYDVSSNPLVFTAEDGYASDLHRRIIWQGSYDAPTIVSGGTQISSWTPTTLNGSAVYVASVPPFSSTDNVPNAVRQVWVNGYRGTRTVASPASVFGTLTPWYDSTTATTGYTVTNLPEAFVTNGSLVEFAWPIVIHNWIEPRCTVSSIEANGQGGGNITLQTNCGILLRNRCQGNCPSPVFMEAVPLFPLQPGTFWYDSNNNLLYYALTADQTLNDLQTNTYISTSEVLVGYANTTNHAWNNVIFSYATWYGPNRNDGYVDDQAAVYDICAAPSDSVHSIESCQITSIEPVGAVRVATSTYISFTNCIFIHIGAAYALSIDQGSQDVTVQGCNFTDLSGGFLKLGSISGPWSTSTNQSMWDARAIITDNVADTMALEISGAAGLFGGYLYSAYIVHNSISDSGYDGISVGWGWGAGATNPGVGNNTVNYNYMHDVMSKLRDGGGIYVNGFQSYPSYMINNYVDTDEAVFAVFYLDNGASLWNVTNNVAYNSSLAWAAYLQGCCNLPAYNSTVDYLYYKGDLDPVNECQPQGCVLENAIKIPTTSPWPTEAQAIMAEAGARPSFNIPKRRKWRY